MMYLKLNNKTLFCLISIFVSSLESSQQVLCATAFQSKEQLTKPLWGTNRKRMIPSVESDRNNCLRSRQLSEPKAALRVLASSSTALCAAFKFKNLEEMLTAYQEQPVLLAFTAINCGPCKLQKRELMNFRQMFSSENQKITMLAIDTEKWPQVGSRFEVGKLPCLMVIRDKQVLMRMEGLTKAEDLVERIRAYL